MSKTHFARRLRELRKTAGLSMYRLAKLARLSNQAIGYLEEGTRDPSWDTVQKLAAALKVSTEEFRDPGIVAAADEALRPVPKRKGKRQ
jgi:transcriptional regulator with XRE-family HTH domain